MKQKRSIIGKDKITIPKLLKSTTDQAGPYPGHASQTDRCEARERTLLTEATGKSFRFNGVKALMFSAKKPIR